MTIKELEERLGLPRASIRFYEQEGFIRPARGENNYRDYSEEDLATLEKVKLLRQLGLSLEDIRKAQRGERPLSALLAAQEAALERQRAGLTWAENVCRAMREDGAEFATLEPEKYLHAPDRPAEGGFSLEGDVLPKMAYPWRRFFARTLDLGLYTLFWMAFGLLVEGIGEEVITSGLSAVYPGGIPVGYVEEVVSKEGEDFYRLKIKFSEDYHRIRNVYIVKDLYKEELESCRQVSGQI